MAVRAPAPAAAASDGSPAVPKANLDPASSPVSRLAGVDGLRAVAALWVVLFHIRVFSGAQLPLQPLDFFARSGSTGVSLFLVMSGFCLFLPFAGGRFSRFRTWPFLIRRARRLLPAYYCSLILAVGLYAFGGSRLGFAHLSLGDMAWQLVTHLAMIHTLFASTFYALNGAYWSLGLEWQLYLALPLLIVAGRRFGLLPALAGAVLVNVAYRLFLAWAASAGWLPSGTVQSAVLPNLLPGRWAEFAVGMLVAEVYVRGMIERLPRLVRYAWLPVAAVAAAKSGLPLSHLGFGAAFGLLLIAVLTPNGLVSRIFAWRPLVALGIMSYSLYLVHQPLIQALAFLLRHDVGLSPTATFGALVLLLPVIVAVAWVLFVSVERFSLTSHPLEISGRYAALLFPSLRRRRSGVQPALVSPPAP